MDAVKMQTHELIRFYRQKAGLTQQQLADKLGVSQQYIGNYESGKRQPKIQTLQKIADALDVDVFSLADFDTATKMIEDDINQKEEPVPPKQKPKEVSQLLTTKEMQHIKKYRLLNEAGKEKTDEYMDLLLGNEDFRKSEKLLEVAARSGDHLQVPDNGALDDMVVSYPDDL